MSDSAWDQSLQEYLIDEGYCYAGCIAGTDGQIWTLTALSDHANKTSLLEGDARWEKVYKEPRYEKVLQEDGETMKDVWCDEANTLWYVAKHRVDAKKEMGAAWAGFYLAGKNYKLTRNGELEANGKEIPCIWCQGEKKGVCVAMIPEGTG